MVDAELIEAARELVRQRYVPEWHEVGAAMRTASGAVFTAVHLDANIGRVSVCAETIALGRAVTAGDPQIRTVVAVRHPEPDDPDRRLRVVSPCGICREMLTDYAPDATVIHPDAAGEPVTALARDLLPYKYRREHPLGHGRAQA